MAEHILVGRFGAPHGVRGEIRLQSFTQDPLAIATYGALAAPDGRSFTLKGVRLLRNNMLVARVEGIADRAAAQALNHVELTLSREALPVPDDEDEFYVADLIGLEAVDQSGAPFGTIVAVPNYGGGDLLEVRPLQGGETLLFPFTKAVVPAVEIAARRITVAPPAEVEIDDG